MDIRAKVTDTLIASGLSPEIKARMSQSIKNIVTVRATGHYAEFSTGQTFPHKSTELVPPPSAISGIYNSICFKPCVRWLPVATAIQRKPRLVKTARNEPMDFALDRSGAFRWESNKKLMSTDARVPTSHLLLADVEYIIAAMPWSYVDNGVETPAKYGDIFTKRIRNGQYYNPPSFGPGECRADLEPFDGEFPDRGQYDLCYQTRLPYALYVDAVGRFHWIWYEAQIRNGLMIHIPWEVLSKSDLEHVLTNHQIAIDASGTYSIRFATPTTFVGKKEPAAKARKVAAKTRKPSENKEK